MGECGTVDPVKLTSLLTGRRAGLKIMFVLVAELVYAQGLPARLLPPELILNEKQK